jgi:hypothetical protein
MRLIILLVLLLAACGGGEEPIIDTGPANVHDVQIPERPNCAASGVCT